MVRRGWLRPLKNNPVSTTLPKHSALVRAAVARSCLGASSPPVGKPGARQSSNLAALQQPAALQTAALEVATPGSCRGMAFVGIFANTISCTPSGDGFLPNIDVFRNLNDPPVVLFWGHVCLLCGPVSFLLSSRFAIVPLALPLAALAYRLAA